MRQLIWAFVLLLVVGAEWSSAEDIVPVRTGGGPTPPPGGRRRKDPTADLPDLSRDELLAILDLIEKSGDSAGKSPVGSPNISPDSVTMPPRYTTAAPAIGPRIPSGPVPLDLPDPSAPPKSYPAPTVSPIPYPTPSYDPPAPAPTVPQYPLHPTPPNYPAPTAPPPPNYPAPPPPTTTTPKPKKSFFDKLVRGFMKIVSPQTAVNSRSAIASSGAPPQNFLGSFLQQLQQTYQNSQQSGGEQKSFTASTQTAVLDNLVKRLQGQNSEGSQFVVNLVQSLKSTNNPSAAPAGAPVNARTGGQAEQFLGSLLRGISSSGSQGGGQGGQGGMGGFLETFQKELLRSHNPSAGPTGQKSAGDVLLDGFKQILQKNP